MKTAVWTLALIVAVGLGLLSVSCPASDEQKSEQPATPAGDRLTMKTANTAANSAASFGNSPQGIGPLDWGQWGGSSIRNNTPQGKNIPTEWATGTFDKDGKWVKEGAKNIKWVAQLGSQSYGNPVVANGQVYVGTNNGAGYLKRYPADTDLGVLLCFRESDGKFLWQHSNEKLPTGRVHDWPLQGICSTPLVEGNRLWYVTSRGEVVCLDTQGFHDNKDDGPVTREPGRLFDVNKNDDPAKDKFGDMVKELKAGKISTALAAEFKAAGLELPAQLKLEPATLDDLKTVALVPANETELPAGQNFKCTFKPAVGLPREVILRIEGARLSVYKLLNTDDKDEADVVWRLNMMTKLGVSQHNMCSCSVTTVGDILLVNSSNGVDESHGNLPAPLAPTFIALNKNTGEVMWTDNSPAGNVLHGQWSSPAFAVLGGTPQAILGCGDGWVYSFLCDGTSNGGKAELLWKFDCNPKESKYALSRADRNHIIGTPVVYDGLVYVGVGEDPEHGEGAGHMWCIDPTKRGDVSPELAFNVADLSKPIPHKRMQAVDAKAGDVTRPNPNSAAVWHYDKYDRNKNGKIEFEETMHRTCGSVAIKDGLLFVADFSGLFHCVDAKTGIPYWTHDMLDAAWGSPLIVEDKVYIGDEGGDIAVFRLSKEMELLGENPMSSGVYSTPVVANNTLFIADKDHLFAIEAKGK